jgi:hypothetical protein
MAAEDPRTPITLPADMRRAFLEHMRHHMDSLDDVMARLAAADFKGAAKVAREELVPGAASPQFGRGGGGRVCLNTALTPFGIFPPRISPCIKTYIKIYVSLLDEFNEF